VQWLSRFERPTIGSSGHFASCGPALLAVVGHVRLNVEDVPKCEQWVCIGAGIMNFLNVLHLMGYGAKVLSGASVRELGIGRSALPPNHTTCVCRAGSERKL